MIYFIAAVRIALTKALRSKRILRYPVGESADFNSTEGGGLKTRNESRRGKKQEER
jgi:hypothetical protein